MLIKHPDDRSHHAEQLHEFKASYPQQAAAIDRELLRLYLRESIQMFAELLEMQMDPLDEHVVILHDLRLKHPSGYLEIDHLLINRNLRLTLVSSAFIGAESLRINADGESFVWSNDSGKWVAVGRGFSELEDKARQLDLILSEGWWPRRLGIRLARPIETCLVVDDHDRVVLDDPAAYESRVIKLGDFLPWYSKNRMSTPLLRQSPKALLERLTNRVDLDTLERIAFALQDEHQPAPLDYYHRLGLDQLEPVCPVEDEDEENRIEEEDHIELDAQPDEGDNKAEPTPPKSPQHQSPPSKTAKTTKTSGKGDNDRQPSSRIAAGLKLKTPEFLEAMTAKGMLRLNDKGELELTEAGRRIGGRVRGRGGNRSFSWLKSTVDPLFAETP
ncbi:hypothetical protein SAMN05421693_10661 [Ectothiorhodospira magna]|uniref:NERD domain-containing protein n=1 Tax=Ectothiorhodospira magna TaxID=867345 RepID=A0A1H9ASI6_9GAMM|nr:nuclease-related domain-containing protein [Ectothiorhodospira magna]SEP79619.1 hypothetical protein SAMN05421693_10661 [Ectothiorhodospira magna]